MPPAALCFTNVTAEADVAKLQPLGSEVRPGSLRDSVEGFGRLCVLDPKVCPPPRLGDWPTRAV